MKTKTMKEDLLVYDNEPFVFFEGGTGLEDVEELIFKECISKNIDAFKLDDLYKKPDKLGSIPFLKPKTVVLGTTGVYESKIKYLVEILSLLDLSSIEKVILTLETEREIYSILRLFKNKYPKIEYYKLDYETSNYETHNTQIYKIDI